MVEVEVCCRSEVESKELLRRCGDELYDLSREGSLRLVVAGEGEDEDGDVARREDAARFHAGRCHAGLGTSRLGRVLVRFSSIGSTQDVVRGSLGHRIGHGLVVVADEQSAGRGRRGASWTSPFGCLTCSIAVTLPAGSGNSLPFLQYVVALAIVEATEGNKEWEGLNLRIKWPNDIYLGSTKVGGILCEGSSSPEGELFVSIGVGINVTNDAPTTSLLSALQRSSSRDESSNLRTISRESLLAALLNALEPLFETFLRDGFAKLSDRYYAKWLHGDQEVILENMQNRTAKVIGLSPSTGSILVRLNPPRSATSPDVGDENTLIELDPYETSLDIVSSTLKTKVSANTND